MKELKNSKFVELKVYKNKKTGQRTVILPLKKIMNKELKMVKVKW